jgi:hypothetical protein
MNDIEDRLRDGYHAVERAIRPETIRPPVLPSRPRRQTTRFMPLAAAAAVIVVIVGAVTVPHLLTGSPAPAATANPGTLPANGTPHYLADLISHWIEVRDPATGKVLSRTPAPAGGNWQGIAAIEGGTKFLVETPGDPCNGDKPSKLYVLTPGKPGGLDPLMTLPGVILGFTGSADGSTLAYLSEQCKKDGGTGSELVSVVRKGTTRDWTLPSSVLPGSLSLSADGSELGYVNTTWLAQRGTALVLPTSSPSGSAVWWSRAVFVPTRGQEGVGLVLSPDGQTMYLLTAPVNQSGATTVTLSAYNVATGTRLRTLHAWSSAYGEHPVIAADGIHALILGMHLTSIDEVNLATGAAGWFHQLRDGTGNVFAVAW